MSIAQAPTIPAAANERVDAADPAQPKRWRVGTLVYSTGGLVVLFCWLLWGDFAWSMKDRSIQGVVQLLLRNAPVAQIVARLQQLGRTQQTAHVVGAIVRMAHALLPPALETRNCSRTARAARAITCSLSKAALRGRYFMPQSGAITSRSRSMCSSADQMRRSTVC